MPLRPDSDHDAVCASAARHQLVVAPPGSGKTCLSVRLAAAAVTKLAPFAKVLLLTFSTQARTQLEREAARQLDPGTRARIEITNYHRFFWHGVRSYRRALDLPMRIDIGSIGRRRKALEAGDPARTKILSRQPWALDEVRGKEEQGHGPLVVLLDRSSSMAEGDKDPWALATTLALLSLAKDERRTFAVVGFSASIDHEVIVRRDEKLPGTVLGWPPDGGTDISGALCRGLEIISSEGDLREADIVLVTDGESDAESASAIRKVADERNVTILGLAIEVASERLQPWCHHVLPVHALDRLGEATADAMAQVI